MGIRTTRGRAAESPLRKLAPKIADISGEFYARGWALGTSGNLSGLVQADPLRLAITASGMDKGRLKPSDVLEIDGDLNVLHGKLKPSSESAIHVAIVRRRPAGAVFHTHSTWGTILSETHASEGGLEVTGYEMLKGLEGVRSHEHSEWLPILENSQDMKKLSADVAELLDRQPAIHGFLLRGHGLYTWGTNLPEAKRHVEIFEFLMEVLVRTKPHQSRT
jgi:methylthioribulose-1-phosphate dehydratase